MEQILEKFKYDKADPLAYARAWKANGGKVAGVMGMFVPEEIVHAAGMLPVVMLEKEAPIQKAQAYIQNVMCGYIRSVVDQAVCGEYDFMDCVVDHDCCHVIRMMMDVMNNNSGIKNLTPLFFPVPLRQTHGWTFMLKELKSYKERIEAVAGVKITDEKLANSIKIYNEHRRLLKELYQIRRENPGLLTAVQVSDIVASSMLMDKEEHNGYLRELIEALKKAEKPAEKRIPVVLTASLCEACDQEVLEAIEESGAVVVDDDLYVGSRYFATEVSENIPPMEALASAYMNMKPHDPTRFDPNNRWGDILVGMCRESGAQGVISIMVKFCEAHGYENYIMSEDLKKADVPFYVIETEHEINSVEQIRTRVEGFVEQLTE